MDISLVRRKFQHLWDFTNLTSPLVDLSTAFYSLQQESLNSEDMLLYITFGTIPTIEGDLIESKGQRWIVYQYMKEVVNLNLYEFKMYPVLAHITLAEVQVKENDMGVIIDPVTTVDYELDCYIESYSMKEKSVPTAQPVESYQQQFYVAAKQIPDYRGTYVLYYKGIKFKIDSFERINGVVRIRATEDL